MTGMGKDVYKRQRLNLVMMETELPDVIMEIPVTDVLKYGETGVILPLNDYIITRFRRSV